MSSIISIGKPAPNFKGKTTMGDIYLSDFKGRWVILFSYCGDFTPVCTTEIIELSKSVHNFIARNTQLLGVSTDSNASHLAWLYAIKMTSNIEVPFPIISDQNGEISTKYEMFSIDRSFCTNRNVYFIDNHGKIRAILKYPPKNGRNIAELIRILDALQTSDISGNMTPANWQNNQATVLDGPKTFHELIIREDKIEDNYCDNWNLCFESDKKSEH